VRDPGSELAERGKFFRLDEPVLRGPQVLYRSRQFLRALLLRLEQPYVLDGDHRLVCKGRHQVDLALGKRVNPAPCQPDDADWLAFAHERHADHRAILSDLGFLLFLIERIGPCVVDPGDLPGHGGTADDRSLPRYNRRFPLNFQICRIEAVASRETVNSILPSKDHARFGAAESRRGVHDTLQDGLQLELGSADDAKNV
jgi:hypothetical protein